MKKSRVVKNYQFVETRLIILGRCVALWVNKVLILESKFYLHRTANTVHDLLTCRTANCFNCQLCGSSTVPRYSYLDFSCDCVPQHIPALSQFKLSLVTGNILLCSDWLL